MFDQTIVVTTEERRLFLSSSTPTSRGRPPPPPASTPPATRPPPPNRRLLRPSRFPQPRARWSTCWTAAGRRRLWWTACALSSSRITSATQTVMRSWPRTIGDTELPQSACAAVRVRAFARRAIPRSPPKASRPRRRPYVSGLTTDGPTCFRHEGVTGLLLDPLAAWTPAHGAAATKCMKHVCYPWSTEGPVFTFGTSALLQDSSGKSLTPGTWYYRCEAEPEHCQHHKG